MHGMNRLGGPLRDRIIDAEIKIAFHEAEQFS